MRPAIDQLGCRLLLGESVAKDRLSINRSRSDQLRMTCLKALSCWYPRKLKIKQAYPIYRREHVTHLVNLHELCSSSYPWFARICTDLSFWSFCSAVTFSRPSSGDVIDVVKRAMMTIMVNASSSASVPSAHNQRQQREDLLHYQELHLRTTQCIGRAGPE